MRKILLKILFLIVLFLGLVGGINIIFIPKRFDGITPMKSFYAQEEGTVDALFLGSSHCGVNIDMGELWKSYGISGFALWGSEQPSWNSYFYLKEALKTQTPKVVAFEVYMLIYQFEYQDESRQLVNTGGMRPSYNKWEAIKVSAPRERWLNLMLGYPLYHTRYFELSEEDFLFFPNNRDLVSDKGSICRWGTGEFELPDVSGITECISLYEKEERYLRMMIELCQKEDIEIILFSTPEAYRETEQPYYNSIDMIAQEYGIEYLNFNLMDDITGFTGKDIWPDGGHLNASGARKIARAMGAHLQSCYGLEDHRGQEKYSSWDKNVDMLEKEYLRLILNKEEYFLEISDTEYTCLLIQNNTKCLMETEQADKSIVIVRELNGETDITSVNWNPDVNVIDLGEEFLIYLTDGIAVYKDGEPLLYEGGNCAAVVVYDERNKQVVDMIAMLQNNNFMLEHREVR